MLQENQGLPASVMLLPSEDLSLLIEDSDKALPKVVRQAISQWLGVNVQSRMDLVTLSQRGIEANRFYAFQQENAWLGDEIFNHIVAPEKLAYERSRNLLLSRTQTNRFIRVMKVIAIARCVLGNEGTAGDWLNSPQEAFSGLSAAELLKSEDGPSLIIDQLVAIEQSKS